MAAVTTTKTALTFEFDLERGEDKKQRTFSVDDVPETLSAAGASAAANFLDVFTGGISSPFTAIVPTEFFQPTGWRDNDPEEDPWTTVGGRVSHITTTKTTTLIKDTGGGGDEPTPGPTGGLSDSDLHFSEKGSTTRPFVLSLSNEPVTAFATAEGGSAATVQAGSTADQDGYHSWQIMANTLDFEGSVTLTASQPANALYSGGLVTKIIEL